jgi:hypothetical protein
MTCKNNCIQKLFTTVESEHPEMTTYQAFCAGMINALGNLYISMQDPEDSEDVTMAMMAHILDEATIALVPEGENAEDFSIISSGPIGGQNYH